MKCPPEHHPVKLCVDDAGTVNPFWGANILSHNWSEPYICHDYQWESDSHSYEVRCLDCGAFIRTHVSKGYNIVFGEWAAATTVLSINNCEENIMRQALE